MAEIIIKDGIRLEIKKISELPITTELSGNDIVPVSNNIGDAKSITYGNFLAPVKEGIANAIPTTDPADLPFVYNYNVSEAGTYTLFLDGSSNPIVVEEGDFETGLVQLRKENGVWKKVITPIPLTNYPTKNEIGLNNEVYVESNPSAITSTPASATRTLVFGEAVPVDRIIDKITINAVVAGDIVLGEYKITGGNIERVSFKIVTLVVGLNVFTDFSVAAGNYIGYDYRTSTYLGRVGVMTATASGYSYYLYNGTITTPVALPANLTNVRFGVKVEYKNTALLAPKVDILEERIDDINTKFYSSGNLINKDEIVFGKGASLSGIVDSGVMHVKLNPRPQFGTYYVAGVAALSAFRDLSGTFNSLTVTRKGDFFLVEIPTGTNDIYINMASDPSQWHFAETVYMGRGDTPTAEYLSFLEESINSKKVAQAGGLLPFGGLFDRPESVGFGYKYFDKDIKDILTYTPAKNWIGTHGQMYSNSIGRIYNWDFSGGSLAADGITLGGSLTINTETYNTGNSYEIDVPLVSGYTGWLEFPTPEHVFEYGYETIEFDVDRFGTDINAQIGLMYIGKTLARTVDALAVIASNDRICLRDSSTRSSYLTNLALTEGITSFVGKRIRIIHQFLGGGRRIYVYDITNLNNVVLLGKMTFTFLNGYTNRPNNRKFGIALSDCGITITKFEVYNMETERARMVVLGDSITATRVASNYDLGFSKQVTEWYGTASYVHAGGSNTCEDLLNSLEDTLIQNPSIVVLAIGTNDCNLDKVNRYTEYQSIVDQLEASGAEVIISNVIPADGTDTARMTRIKDFNSWLQTTFGSSNKIVDQFSALANDTEDDWNPSYRGDELHPNDSGMKVMYENLKSLI